MYNFDFYNPTRILFGKDRLDGIDKLVPSEAKVLITFGGGSAKKYGLIDKVKANLSGREVFEFGGIEPNPRYETLAKRFLEELCNSNLRDNQSSAVQIWYMGINSVRHLYIPQHSHQIWNETSKTRINFSILRNTGLSVFDFPLVHDHAPLLPCYQAGEFVF
jgi:hypothetical protein